jgi:ornithine carbamoyltransferase
MTRDILSVLDMKDDLKDILDLAAKLKKGKNSAQPLKGKSIAMIFEKSSTRTRTSFEAGIFDLGGHPIFLSQKESQLGRGETMADTARVLSRYVDGIVYRALSHEAMVELAEYSSVPVINALDDLEHPCQIAADLQTIREKKGKLEGLKMAYIGDGNNVCNSLLLGAALTGINFMAGCPSDYLPNKGLTRKAAELAKGNGCSSDIVNDPKKAVEGADVVYTDAWISMGQEAETEKKEMYFRDYQINAPLLAGAKKDVIFMHCLPAHRGLEVTDEVIDGPRSVVFDQAENRLHAQKAILIKIIV